MKQLCKIFSMTANLQEQPGAQTHIGRRDSQMLHGELFHVDRWENNWVHGTSALDGYTGWLPDTDVQLVTTPPTHAIITLSTNAYATPDAKTHPLPDIRFSFMSRVAIDPGISQNKFVMLRDYAAWIPESHVIALSDLAANPADIVDTATMFSDCPYVLGGRSAQGIDCSGLVQLALQRNGVYCPRDADQQENVIGTAIANIALQRGDIIYFPGHVAIMADHAKVINATMRHMKVIVEPLDDLIQAYGPPTAVRRLAPG
jgi:cell wall-associated NlpC family hydrolase